MGSVPDGSGVRVCDLEYSSNYDHIDISKALELQWDYNVPATVEQDLVPIEWWLDSWPDGQTFTAVYAAIQNAQASLIHVVEAGGNCRVNTDAMSWFGDSGAIIVGAGGAYPGGVWGGDDLERMQFSSFGARFNLQGWGENVATTGYGDLFDASGTDADFTEIFSGTSSASPHVAAAMACYSVFEKGRSGPVLPLWLRNQFELTGTPQAFGLGGTIGPRPDLRCAGASSPHPGRG